MSKQLPERVIGFDAREMWLAPEDYWYNECREKYLLRLDASKLLSVDISVWASVLDGAQGNKTWDYPETPNDNAWDNQEEMDRTLADFGEHRLGRFWTIAITVVVEPPPGWRMFDWHPKPPEDAWTFLGYDVADEGLLSGLMNCGYLEGETKPPGKGLNQHHLFESMEEALSFKTYTDERVEEHAPFRVYGIYKIRESDGL